MPKYLSAGGLISVAVALTVSPALFAQGGHGPGGGFSGGGHSPGSFGHVTLSGGNSTAAHWGVGGAVVPPVASSGNWYFSLSGSNQHGYGSYRSGWGNRQYPAGYVPYFAAAYPFLYPYSFADSAPPPNGGEAYGPPPEADQPNGLMMELDAIHHELAELKQRQAEAPYGMAPEGAGPQIVEQRPAKPSDPPLILVFRDGTRTEVRDFAVVGQMFWDLSGHPTRKYPISQLNIEASIQANEDRGVEFPEVPQAK